MGKSSKIKRSYSPICAAIASFFHLINGSRVSPVVRGDDLLAFFRLLIAWNLSKLPDRLRKVKLSRSWRQ
jgi:hypothetical protein